MDLKQLKYFKTVVEQGGVNRASERLHISQPAITVAIKKLECSLNVRLFVKEGRSLRPTTDGMKLYQHACHLLSHCQNIIADMHTQQDHINETLSIQASPIIAQNYLQTSLRHIINLYPNTQIKMTIDAGINIQNALLNEEIDLGISAHVPLMSCIESVCFYKEDLRVIVSEEHELVQCKDLTWKQLLDYELVTLPSPYVLRRELNKVSDYYKMPLKIRLETDSISNIMDTINHSMLIAILPESVINNHESVVSLPLPLDESVDLIFKSTIELYALVNTTSTIKSPVKVLIDNLINTNEIIGDIES